MPPTSPAPPAVPRRLVLWLGLSQLVCWGVSYYLVGVFGDRIARELGWSRSTVHAGFSLALVVMGVASPVAGRLIDRVGGRRVMVAGSLLSAAGCAGIAASHGPAAYFASWACLGLAMRLTLYDAAFAALARIGGPGARRPIAQITLLGGLASTTFWPIGHALAERIGWRGALLVYAGFALLTVPLHLAIPATRHAVVSAPGAGATPGLAAAPADRRVGAALYAVIVMLAAVLNSAMSAHMIGILAGLGVAASLSVWIATLRGVGQTAARLLEVLFGARLHPLRLNLVSTGILPIGFAAGLVAGPLGAGGVLFAFLFGAGNGLSTIARGTLPLALFDPRTYGAFVGGLLVPSFLAAAAAPFGFAVVMERFGARAALLVSLGIAATMLAAAIALEVRFSGRRRGAGEG